MSYHSIIFTNKEFKKHFSKDELRRMSLVSVVGTPARTKNKVSKKGDIITVFGSDFVAKVRMKGD